MEGQTPKLPEKFLGIYRWDIDWFGQPQCNESDAFADDQVLINWDGQEAVIRFSNEVEEPIGYREALVIRPGRGLSLFTIGFFGGRKEYPLNDAGLKSYVSAVLACGMEQEQSGQAKTLLKYLQTELIPSS